MKQKFLMCLMVLGLFVGSLAVLPQNAFAAENKVGIINVQEVFSSYPNIQTLTEVVRLEEERARNDFNSNTEEMSDEEKNEYANKLSLQVSKVEAEVMGPINEAIMKAIQKVAKDKGLDTVLNSGAVVTGGKDITREVIEVLNKN